MQILILAVVAPLTMVGFQNCSSFKGGITQLTTTSELGTGSGSGPGSGSGSGIATPTPIPTGSGSSATPTPTPTPTPVPAATPLPTPTTVTSNVTQTTILASQMSPSTLPSGYPVTVVYNWIGVPMDSDYKVFVHVTNSAGATITQDDHGVYPQTTIWSGPLSYSRAISIPPGTPDGVYHVNVGLWYPHQVPLASGSGVIAHSDYSYDVGTFTISAAANPPVAINLSGTKKLDLSNYAISFQDEFSGPLDVSAWGPNTKWISNKPDGQNFGYVGSSSAFSISNGILDIQLKRDSNNNWAGGILSSVDGNGNGFAQQYGYFEMRAKLPGTSGSWPAFWLLSQKAQQNSGQHLGLDAPAVEIDILEQYSSNREQDMTYHFWKTGALYFAINAYITDMFADYHTYGVMIDPTWMVYYTDGVEVGRQATPPEANQPFYPIVNLAVHDTNAPNPAAVSHMLVDYVRVYQSKSAYSSPVAVPNSFVPSAHLNQPLAFIPMNSMLYLRAPTSAAGTAMVQDSLNGAKDEEFLLSDAGSGNFYIKNVSSGLCLGIAGASGANGAALDLENCAAIPTQVFKLTLNADYSFELRNIGSNRCPGVESNGTEAGKHIIQWDCTGGANSNYLIRPTSIP